MRLGCVAESLAVAVEFGTALAGAGMRTVLLPRLPEGGVPEAEAVVIVASPDEAAAACDALLADGAPRLAFAIGADFDGRAVAATADALLRRLRAGFAAVAPGFPSRGRSVYLGHLFLGAALAGGEANLVRRLSAGADAPVGSIPFALTERGAAAMRGEMSRLAEGGRRYAIVDSVTDAALDALVEASAAQALLVGGAGLARGLAAALGGSGAEEAAPSAAPGVALVASAERATLAQVGFARLHAPVLDLRDAADAARVLEEAARLLGGGAPVIVAAPDGAELAGIAEVLVARGAGRVLVAGGAACVSVVARLGPRALRIGAPFDAGVAWCEAEGGPRIALMPAPAGGRDLLLRAFGEAGP